MELLTNITVVDDAIRFVSEKSKNKEEQVKIHLLLLIDMMMKTQINWQRTTSDTLITKNRNMFS
jgi:hypothetical protein